MTLHPTLQAMLDASAAAGDAPKWELTPVQLRARVDESAKRLPAGPAMHRVDDVAITSGEHRLSARRYRPAASEPAGTVVYFHSGGWVVGSLDSCDSLVRRLALASGCEYLSVDYRLAPEHPFPAAAGDALAAVEYAATLGRPVVLHGDSAGGNLAAVAALAGKDTPRLRVVLQVLVYPVTDSAMSGASFLEHADQGLLTAADMAWFWNLYVPNTVDRADVRAAPALASLEGAPPAFLVIAEYDPLRDEGLAYAESLHAAGTRVTVRHYPDMCHGFFGMAGILSAADEAVAAVGTAIRIAVTGSGKVTD